MTTPTRFRGSVRTINETSFAVAYGDATALVLDAVTLIGVHRKEKFVFAKDRVQTALLYADTPEEKALARQLLSYIQVAGLKGWNA